MPLIISWVGVDMYKYFISYTCFITHSYYRLPRKSLNNKLYQTFSKLPNLQYKTLNEFCVHRKKINKSVKFVLKTLCCTTFSDGGCQLCTIFCIIFVESKCNNSQMNIFYTFRFSFWKLYLIQLYTIYMIVTQYHN